MAATSAGATLRDVADAAGVSLTTASRALSGSTHRVADVSRQRVLEAAQRLQYRPNRSAQAMTRGLNETVGLVVMDIADPSDHTITAGLLAVAESAGLLVTVTASENHHEIGVDAVAGLVAQRPRALVLVGSVGGEGSSGVLGQLESFTAEGGRVVLVSQSHHPYDTVSVDQTGGAQALAEAVVARGYRSFALLTGPARSPIVQERLAGFRAGLAAHGIEVADSAVIGSDGSRDGGYAAAGEWLTRHLDNEIILATNDAIAVGAISRFREAGLTLPDDLAIAGFDGIAPLRDITPSLTTVELPLEQIGAEAMKLALQPTAEEPRRVVLTGEVVVKESTPGV
ncbi:MAG: LacI family transcriptional regulator [Propionibacteriaceae bacterium]|jgi:LacI family transcriptional regulator|nr:LacI family transcriptional regulator [Propionibacteriaceae bacterium]